MSRNAGICSHVSQSIGRDRGCPFWFSRAQPGRDRELKTGDGRRMYGVAQISVRPRWTRNGQYSSSGQDEGHTLRNLEPETLD